MIRPVLFPLLLALVSCQLHAQSDLKSNGPNNLQSICSSDDCIYVEIAGTISFPPTGPKKQWELYNLEIATSKVHGKFVATGDMAVVGIDTAAILTMELQFFDKGDQLLFTHRVEGLEFYNESRHAEPLLISGALADDMIEKVEYVGFDILGSKVIPYYEMKTSCYHACKNHQLNQAIKEFRKSK